MSEDPVVCGNVVWAIERREGDLLIPLQVRPHVEQMDGTWRRLDSAILATSKACAYAFLPAGSLMLFETTAGVEWWAPWSAPRWWWPEDRIPRPIPGRRFWSPPMAHFGW